MATTMTKPPRLKVVPLQSLIISVINSISRRAAKSVRRCSASLIISEALLQRSCSSLSSLIRRWQIALILRLRLAFGTQKFKFGSRSGHYVRLTLFGGGNFNGTDKLAPTSLAPFFFTVNPASLSTSDASLTSTFMSLHS